MIQLFTTYRFGSLYRHRQKHLGRNRTGSLCKGVLQVRSTRRLTWRLGTPMSVYAPTRKIAERRDTQPCLASSLASPRPNTLAELHGRPMAV